MEFPYIVVLGFGGVLFFICRLEYLQSLDNSVTELQLSGVYVLV